MLCDPVLSAHASYVRRYRHEAVAPGLRAATCPTDSFTDPVGGKTWIFRVTLLPPGATAHSNKTQLMMKVIGCGSVALCWIRVVARSPHHDIILPVFDKCGPESVHGFVEVDVSCQKSLRGPLTFVIVR